MEGEVNIASVFLKSCPNIRQSVDANTEHDVGRLLEHSQGSYRTGWTIAERR